VILQLNPTMPLTTPLGRALCHFLIDNGDEHHLLWVCIQDDTGEIWVWPNPDVRGRPNPTMGRKINGTADRIEKLEAENAELQSKVNTVRLAAKYAAKIRDDRIEKLEAALRWIIEQERQTAHPTVCAIVENARKALNAE
jgi:hypothetical protein